MIAQLRLTGAQLANLTSPEEMDSLGIAADIHRCEWRAILDEGRMPETHALRERLLERGFDGVIYPSFMSPGGTCVALWRWNGPSQPKLDIVYPDGRMPRTPASWL